MTRNTRTISDKKTNEEAPCILACPIRQDARDYVQLIARGRFSEAFRLVRERNPLPAACGRICTHPCETKCRRNSIDAPVAIAWLKRFLGDNFSEETRKTTAENYPERIAIIGAGPAGLAAANDLALLGYSCTIFESNSTPGGMLRMGVPTYRLPRTSIDDDVDFIKKLGVEFRYNTTFGTDITFDSLKNDGFSVIFLGVGLLESRTLNIEGVQFDGVIKGIPFLNEVNTTGRAKIGKRVLVIGGGAVAMDCARTALRLKPDRVSVACLESRREMPTTDFEIEEAIHEGAVLRNSVGPKRIIGKDGRVTGLETLKVKYVFDEQRRFNPAFYEGSESIIEADTIILAIGQASNLFFLQGQEDIQVTRGGTIIVNPTTFSASVRNIYAGGDVVLGRGTMTESMAHGKRAAIAIHNALRNTSLKDEKWAHKPAVPDVAVSKIALIKKEQKQEMPTMALDKRLNNFDEVELGFSMNVAVREAQRCMNCGAGALVDDHLCVGCLTCVRVCPFEVPKIETGNTTAYIDGDCQSCGLCVVECPAKAISFKTPLEDCGKEALDSVFQGMFVQDTKPCIVNFYCQYSAYKEDKENAIDDLPVFYFKRVGVLGLGKVEPSLYLRAFELGAHGVLVTACKDDTCHFCKEQEWIERRSKFTSQLLSGLGMDIQRFQTRFVSSQNGKEILEIAFNMADELKNLSYRTNPSISSFLTKDNSGK
ncbi:Glutamate synthase [NADPH] small chain [Candidatus Brocadiaceae bacterium B188]|nr:FAD-dependent oxidoreductase [Candidatus Brocadia sapporoensis]QQR66096.1 MAG: FAD-dependent oxidoreductase [Candidatus Brocadia sp.]RZV57703.1 MAG: hydrogenase iron-sulfur subunit [Candidatus Brocadia sp. BROELEC01]TWU53014.1 Glutamate synthase [NADPH] small chain [Candidatus Brocadiaceae bacterium B188]